MLKFVDKLMDFVYTLIREIINCGGVFVSVIIKSEKGNITITNDVLAKTAGLAATSCYGVVGMAVKTVRDGIVHLLKKESLSKGVEIFVNEDSSVDARVHIIVEYGTNIPAIGDIVENTVAYNLESSLGVRVGSVEVIVEGIRVDS